MIIGSCHRLLAVASLGFLLSSYYVPSHAQGATSTLCKFTTGPRAGQVHDYAPMAAIPVGSPCQDGVASTGFVIARGNSQASAGGPMSGGTTLTCKFTSGPRAGQIQDFSKVPGARPARIGSPCTDGRSSNGVAIKPTESSSTNEETDSSNADDDSSGTSTVCQFNSGPRAGQWHDYAPMQPIRIGSSCQDGAGSTGRVVRSGTGSEF